MLLPGLVSVSFRSLSPEEIIAITKKAGLQCIEWGGDVHVPAGDTETASRVGALTRDAGLLVSSYGAYYRLGSRDISAFSDVLASAKALGTDTVRLWAGRKGSEEVTAEERKESVEEAKELARLAEKEKITLAFECHPDTLTDRYGSAVLLMHEIGADNVRMYWQPNQFCGEAYNMDAVQAILPYLTNVHVFHWPDEKTRKPLGSGAAVWRKYFDCIRNADGNHCCLLEFMPDDAPESLPAEAETLLQLLKVTSNNSSRSNLR